MMTVDWTTWLTDTEAEQQAKLRRYRAIVHGEAMSANWKKMDEAIREAGRRM